MGPSWLVSVNENIVRSSCITAFNDSWPASFESLRFGSMFPSVGDSIFGDLLHSVNAGLNRLRFWFSFVEGEQTRCRQSVLVIESLFRSVSPTASLRRLVALAVSVLAASWPPAFFFGADLVDYENISTLASISALGGLPLSSKFF